MRVVELGPLTDIPQLGVLTVYELIESENFINFHFQFIVLVSIR